MREEPGEARLRSRMLAAVWTLCTLVLTWQAEADVAVGDSGEIGGAAFALGVAHPTGFALDMLVLRWLTFVPLGSIAWRQNAAVAGVTACAVTALAWLLLQLARELRVVRPSCLAAALAVMVGAALSARCVFAAAVGVEVYATSLLLLGCAAGLSCSATSATRAALWPLFGISLAAHVTAALLMLPLMAAEALRLRSAPPRALALRACAWAAAALSIAYLPLASARDGAFDWGDPETLLGLWRHITGARIREAFHAEMFSPSDGAPATALLAQLAQHPLLLAPGLLGAVMLLRKARGAGLSLLAVLCADLAYAVWVNPMGIAQVQVGHASAAILALLAGLGVAWAGQYVCARAAMLGTTLLGVTALAGFGLLFDHAPGSDGEHSVAERYGSGSPLQDLGPRAVYVCSNDSACASALFALYAEGVRPDVDLAPAQHLWDATVTRRLAGLALPSAASAASGAIKAARAQQTLLGLARSCQRRPVYFELWPQPHASDLPAMIPSPAPWLINPTCVTSPTEPAPAELERLNALVRARFGAAGPTSSLARTLWASAYAELGKFFMRVQQPAFAIVAMRGEVELTPERAVAHSNLGVALEAAGDFAGALRETRIALEHDATRPTAWVNLARLVLRMSGPSAAQSVLQEAAARSIRDVRLDELRQGLARAHGSTEK